MYVQEDIRLRKIEEEDLFFLQEIKNETWEHTHRVSFINTADQQNWFKSLNQHATNPRDLVLMASKEDNFRKDKFGVFKIFDIDYVNRTAEVGWDVERSHRGKGLGKRLVKAGCRFCFDVLALRRLNAEILATNAPSLKCAEYAGFVQEGTKRMAVHKLGTFVDSIVLGLLASDSALQSKK